MRTVVLALLLVLASSCESLVGIDPDSPKAVAQRQKAEGVSGSFTFRICYDSAAALVLFGSYDRACTDAMRAEADRRVPQP